MLSYLGGRTSAPVLLWSDRAAQEGGSQMGVPHAPASQGWGSGWAGTSWCRMLRLSRPFSHRSRSAGELAAAPSLLPHSSARALPPAPSLCLPPALLFPFSFHPFQQVFNELLLNFIGQKQILGTGLWADKLHFPLCKAWMSSLLLRAAQGPCDGERGCDSSLASGCSGDPACCASTAQRGAVQEGSQDCLRQWFRL